jgi:hypothetical protein
MTTIIVIQKIVGAAVYLTATTLAVSTLYHGDTALGLLILLGQVQTILGHDNAHKTNHDAQHLAAHKKS